MIPGCAYLHSHSPDAWYNKSHNRKRHYFWYMNHKTHLKADERVARIFIWTGIIIAALLVALGGFTGRVGFRYRSASVGMISNNIKADHHYSDAGLHIVEGWVMTPSECYETRASARVAESYPEQVVLEVSVRQLLQSESCAQGATGIPFKVSFRASSEARIHATLNGRPAKLTLTERQGSLVPLGSPLDLKIREERFVGNTKVRFDAVESDSRCPTDGGVACIQAGEAKLIFTVGGKPVRLSFPGGKTSASIGSHVLKVLELQPAAYAGDVADDIQYRATVQLESSR